MQSWPEISTVAIRDPCKERFRNVTAIKLEEEGPTARGRLERPQHADAGWLLGTNGLREKPSGREAR